MRDVIILLALWVLSPGPVGAAAPPQATLGCTDDTSCLAAEVLWSGLFDPTLTPGLPEQCLLAGSRTCDRFTLTIDLPPGYWASNPGAVEVAIRWPSQSTDRDLDLFIYKENELVGSSTGQDSSAEVAFLDQPGNGTYDVYVVPVSLSVPIEYEGRVEIEPAREAGELRDLLPNMRTLPPHTVRIATAEYLIDPVSNEIVSCYPEETLDTEENVPVRCLRFDQIAANVGEGPLELRYRIASPDDPTPVLAPELRQIIYRSDGSTRYEVAETMELHPIHGHWHYKGFGLGILYDPNDVEVRRSKKNGFCLVDVDFEDWGKKGNSPRKHDFPGCQLPNYQDDEGDWVEQGIGVGWADVYNWFLADQFVDITGLADGVYRLEIVADPDDTLRETDEQDNATSVWLCIHGLEVDRLTDRYGECPAGSATNG